MSERTSNEDILQLAISAAKRNEKDNARVMLMQIYQRDKRNESAMIWLAKIARNSRERVMWLERIVELNPDNVSAQNALEKLKYKEAASENRTLVLFGGVAAVMILLVLVIILLVVL